MSNATTNGKDYTEVITARVTKAQLARLREHAQVLGISQSNLLRGWIDDCNSEQGEIVFADLVLGGLEWLEQAIESDLNLKRCIAWAFKQLGTGDIQGVPAVVRTLKTSIEAYRHRLTPQHRDE